MIRTVGVLSLTDQLQKLTGYLFEDLTHIGLYGIELIYDVPGTLSDHRLLKVGITHGGLDVRVTEDRSYLIDR